jgi:hypothetical protein
MKIDRRNKPGFHLAVIGIQPDLFQPGNFYFGIERLGNLVTGKHDLALQNKKKTAVGRVQEQGPENIFE